MIHASSNNSFMYQFQLKIDFTTRKKQGGKGKIWNQKQEKKEGEKLQIAVNVQNDYFLKNEIYH